MTKTKLSEDKNTARLMKWGNSAAHFTDTGISEQKPTRLHDHNFIHKSAPGGDLRKLPALCFPQVLCTKTLA